MEKRDKFALKAVMFYKRINKRDAQYNRSINVQKTSREGREIHVKRTFSRIVQERTPLDNFTRTCFMVMK